MKDVLETACNGTFCRTVHQVNSLVVLAFLDMVITTRKIVIDFRNGSVLIDWSKLYCIQYCSVVIQQSTMKDKVILDITCVSKINMMIPIKDEI